MNDGAHMARVAGGRPLTPARGRDPIAPPGTRAALAAACLVVVVLAAVSAAAYLLGAPPIAV